ncbi:sulfotransferase [Streptomyces tendae]|uniref:sulfotransferase n=1 Tax=Streptomyces tendae TaxID=1932 RepID=UPI0036AE9E86
MRRAAPGTSGLDERLSALRRMRGAGILDFTGRVRHLVVVTSSSRGGSSMFAELLRSCDSLLHLRGEINPFLRLAGLGFPDSGTGSDLLLADHAKELSQLVRAQLDQELSLDAGVPVPSIADDQQFLLDSAFRFAIQWPDHAVDPMHWLTVGERVLNSLRREHGWGFGTVGLTRFWTAMLAEVLGTARSGDAGYYDLPKDLLARIVPEGPPSGPPGTRLIEEPPFVLAQPWRQVTDDELRTKPLVVKSPSNAYRLGFLRALFPHADMRVIHLTRNPGAAINGLYDGWRYHGFHAHRMGAPLRISDYADDVPDDRMWWKFDLPPGWEPLSEASLMQVCAFQWRASHQHAIEGVSGGVDHLRVRFEDLIRDPATRLRTFIRVAAWLGVPFDESWRRAVSRGLEPVVATEPPRSGRWRARAAEVRAAIDADPDARRVADELGYRQEDLWI